MKQQRISRFRTRSTDASGKYEITSLIQLRPIVQEELQPRRHALFCRLSTVYEELLHVLATFISWRASSTLEGSQQNYYEQTDTK
jgi:hypothetical protein